MQLLVMEDWGEPFTPNPDLVKQLLEKLPKDAICEETVYWRRLQMCTERLEAAKSGRTRFQLVRETHINTEEIVNSILESIESNGEIKESNLKSIPVESLLQMFSDLKLSENGFSNFCKIISNWNDSDILSVCFNSVIFNKINEKEEAAFSTINSLKDLGKSKPEELSKCIIKSLKSHDNFSDEELLENIFVVLPDCNKEAIVRALITLDKFNNSMWSILQVLALKTTTNSFDEIITFMESKCQEFAKNQFFARLLVNICKNLPSDTYKERLIKIAATNETLLKRQALRYLSAS